MEFEGVGKFVDGGIGDGASHGHLNLLRHLDAALLLAPDSTEQMRDNSYSILLLYTDRNFLSHMRYASTLRNHIFFHFIQIKLPLTKNQLGMSLKKTISLDSHPIIMKIMNLIFVKYNSKFFQQNFSYKETTHEEANLILQKNTCDKFFEQCTRLPAFKTELATNFSIVRFILC